jgi:hypothetical protein
VATGTSGEVCVLDKWIITVWDFQKVHRGSVLTR